MRDAPTKPPARSKFAFRSRWRPREPLAVIAEEEAPGTNAMHAAAYLVPLILAGVLLALVFMARPEAVPYASVGVALMLGVYYVASYFFADARVETKVVAARVEPQDEYVLDA